MKPVEVVKMRLLLHIAVYRCPSLAHYFLSSFGHESAEVRYVLSESGRLFFERENGISQR